MIPKAVMMVDPVIGLFEVMAQKYKKVATIVNLVEMMWLTR